MGSELILCITGSGFTPLSPLWLHTASLIASLIVSTANRKQPKNLMTMTKKCNRHFKKKIPSLEASEDETMMLLGPLRLNPPKKKKQKRAKAEVITVSSNIVISTLWVIRRQIAELNSFGFTLIDDRDIMVFCVSGRCLF
jgi:hypothetical protein